MTHTTITRLSERGPSGATEGLCHSQEGMKADRVEEWDGGLLARGQFTLRIALSSTVYTPLQNACILHSVYTSLQNAHVLHTVYTPFTKQ